MLILGLLLHAPTSLQSKVKLRIQKVLKGLLKETPVTFRSSAASEEEPVEVLLSEAVSDSTLPLTAVIENKDRRIKENIKDMLKNLLSRIPDGQEIDHRRIAKSRIWDTI